MSIYDTLHVKTEDRITTLTLNRPEAANSINFAMASELVDAATLIAASDAKVVVLTGAGRFFCAGGDLGDFAEAKDRGQHVKKTADALHHAISVLSRMDAVSICAVNGKAAGAGFSLAISTDFVLATESASFTMAYTRVALSPDGSSSYYLPRLIGIRRTQELMLTNRALSAAEARDWGLINETVDDGQLEDRVREVADGFAAGPAQANAAVKRLLLTSFNNGLEAQMEFESVLIADNALTGDGHEGVDAFLSKRPAHYA